MVCLHLLPASGRLRVLNSEITAPLDSTARGVSNTSMAPAHLQGALFNICMAPAHLQGALTSPCARQIFIPTRGSVCPPTSKGGNFLTKWRFQRNVAFSHLASRDARRRAPRVPFGTTQEEFSFVFNMQVLLPALLPIDRVPARAPKFQITTTRKPDDGARRDFACTSS